jgi:hypothetical protein
MSRARRQLESELRALLREPMEDVALRDRLEGIAEALTLFSGFTWLWGPELYRRNRVLFRPFILARFGTIYVENPKEFHWVPVEWKGATGTALDGWLREVESDRDVGLFRKLFLWKFDGVRGRKRAATFGVELRKRYRLATTDDGRQEILRRFDFAFELDEPTALEIYRADPSSGPYLLRHLDWSWIWFSEGSGETWTQVMALARSRGDDAFAWALYRAQVRLADWQRDALEDCRTIPDPAALDARLEHRHPKAGYRNLGEPFLKLLEARGADVIPYVARHLRQVYGGYFGAGAAGKLVTLARQRGWRGLWAAAARISLPDKGFNAEVRGVLEDGKTSVDEQRENLALLAGVSREWNFSGLGIAQVHGLSETVALLLFRRYPELLRGPYRVHLQCAGWKETYDKLVSALIEAGEEDLVDFVASRFVGRLVQGVTKGAILAEVERLAEYYESLLADPAVFARRAATVLGHVPARTIHQYPRLIRENRLARLLLERTPASYLADPRSVDDLIEGSEIHVMALGYRILGLNDPRAIAMARMHADLLVGTLLRPLHRSTRRLAFGALANAASTPELAARILARAREAFALPDDHYPKDALAILVATILDRWPELRGPREQPTVHRKAVKRQEAA